MRVRQLVAIAGSFALGLASLAAAQTAAPKPDDVVNNPPFAHWSGFKPGTTVTQKQVVTLPDGRKIDQVITQKLMERNKQRIVVETTVSYTDSMVHSTRTVAAYPAKVKMNTVASASPADVSLTEGKEEVTIKGKKIPVEWVEAVSKSGDEVWKEKLWTARDIPGGIIKQTLVHERGGKVVSETLVEMVEFKPGS